MPVSKTSMFEIAEIDAGEYVKGKHWARSKEAQVYLMFHLKGRNSF